MLALVEGQTEEAFVGKSVRPHLWTFGVDIAPTLIVTRRIAAGPDRKGGVGSWAQIERDLRLLLDDHAVVGVTTFVDYYGLPADVPGMTTRPAGPPLARVEHVEAAIDAHMADPRLRAHLAMHEFEALLYVDPDRCGQYLQAPKVAKAMTLAVAQCGGPELVNEKAETAPARRILAAHPSYRKTLDGPAMAELIGLAAIRSACPHFDAWIAWLESVGS